MKVCRFLCVLVSLAVVSTSVFAAGIDRNKAMEEFAKTLPKTGIDTFQPTPIPGLWQVGAGTQIFYFSPKGYLVFGEIWTPEGKNITAEARNKIIEKNLAKLPLDKALTIGDGPIQVFEFTDPDCPFCRKLDQMLAQRTDITRHIFFFPLESIHKSARAHTRFILCSEDKETALREVSQGELDKQPMSNGDCQVDSLIDEHLRAGGSVGVRGTPTLWIDGRPVRGDVETISNYLNRKGAKK